jgi:hypothetical protein
MRPVLAFPAGKKAVNGTTTQREKKPSVVSLTSHRKTPTIRQGLI